MNSKDYLKLMGKTGTAPPPTPFISIGREDSRSMLSVLEMIKLDDSKYGVIVISLEWLVLDATELSSPVQNDSNAG